METAMVFFKKSVALMNRPAANHGVAVKGVFMVTGTLQGIYRTDRETRYQIPPAAALFQKKSPSGMINMPEGLHPVYLTLVVFAGLFFHRKEFGHICRQVF